MWRSLCHEDWLLRFIFVVLVSNEDMTRQRDMRWWMDLLHVRFFVLVTHNHWIYVCSRSHAQVILRPCGSHGLNKPATTLRLFLSPLLVITFRKKINKNHWRHLMWYKTYKWLRSGSRPRSRGMGPLSELLFICLCMPTTCQLWRNHATEKKRKKKRKLN